MKKKERYQLITGCSWESTRISTDYAQKSSRTLFQVEGYPILEIRCHPNEAGCDLARLAHAP